MKTKKPFMKIVELSLNKIEDYYWKIFNDYYSKNRGKKTSEIWKTSRIKLPVNKMLNISIFCYCFLVLKGRTVKSISHSYKLYFSE